jgi:hypothetical protein
MKNILLLSLIFLVGCNKPTTQSSDTEDKSAKTTALEMGAALLQNKAPLDALNLYLDAFHFTNGNIRNQMEAHHYCSVLSDEIHQCILYDSNEKNAKIIGIEYIISADIFHKLSPQEKLLWHSHAYEVKSGQLIAPGLPELAEHALMNQLVNTYGKTWHTWDTHTYHTLPLGVPELMMAFTADRQLDPALLSARDNRIKIDTDERKQNRVDIKAEPVDTEANAWLKGKVFQISGPQ